MRQERGLTQREVAERRGIQRPAVSKMERKGDMPIVRFAEYVEALGGRWQIRVWFADGRQHSAGHQPQMRKGCPEGTAAGVDRSTPS